VAFERIVTIGVYGFTEETFTAALASAGADLFCDLRARRGVRGSNYAFANARRLETLVTGLGIPYRHFPALAPPKSIRTAQSEVDRTTGTTKRQRASLSPEFVSAYASVIQADDAARALRSIAEACEVPILLCVERLPEACHRSLVARALAGPTTPIADIVP
jgi:uncharacterized protein (DUF488 family)